MPYAGRINEITLEEDAPVRASQVVAQIDAVDLQQARSEAEAVVGRFDEAIKENRFTLVEKTARIQAEQFVKSMESTVEAAKERVRAGEKKMNYAETYFGHVSQLHQRNAKSKDELDRADVARVESQVNYRQDVLVLESMRAIYAATALMPKLIDDYLGRKQMNEPILQKQKAEAEARLEQMMTRENRGKMTSPVDGVVLNRHIRDEQYLSAGTVLLEIGQLDRLEIEADVLSQDVVRVKAGDPVEIYGPAIGADAGQGVKGAVQRVFPAGFTKISSLGVEQQRVKVIIRFAEGVLPLLRNERKLGVDYRVRVRIFTDTSENALTVPRSAIFRAADGGWQVFVIRGGRARLQPVEVGLMNDERVAIVDGVEENETVILAPESSLQDGDKVKAILRE
jgi:HlyD family secretion protein